MPSWIPLRVACTSLDNKHPRYKLDKEWCLMHPTLRSTHLTSLLIYVLPIEIKSYNASHDVTDVTFINKFIYL